MSESKSACREKAGADHLAEGETMQCSSWFESLESRRHLAITATLSFLPMTHVGVLSVVGTSANDTINVRHVGARFSVDGVTMQFAATDVQVLRVNAGAGNDNIQLFLPSTDNIMIEVHGDAGD